VRLELTEAVRPREQAFLSSLAPLYFHDLSAYSDFYELDPDGRWHPDIIPDYFANASWHPLLITVDGQHVGFALVQAPPSPYVTPGRDHQMSEFFVLRAFRRRGLGRAAAVAVFDAFPGAWEVQEVPDNASAIAFWRGVIQAYTGGRYTETAQDGFPTQWFTSPP
jgi:predicted acetyltransferase